MDKKQIIEGIKKEGWYIFIANNYYKLSKEDLKTIILELDCATDEEVLKSEYETINNNALIALEERL